MGKLDGTVAFITGAARGQGRNHAIRLAEQGADIIAIDICASFDDIPYDGPDRAEFDETIEAVRATGRRIVAHEADVRDLAALQAAVDEGVREFGRLDIVLANAGIVGYGQLVELDEASWQEMIDIDLTGVWKTVRAACPAMIEAGNGGSVIMTSSTAGLKALNTLGHYVAAKHGVIGLTKTAALEFATQGIRINSICPGTARTKMVNDWLGGDPENEAQVEALHPIGRIAEPREIAALVMWLCSDAASFMCGAAVPIDGGYTIQ
jgi:SDR family mycofactocin-dependent oxidoreductase